MLWLLISTSLKKNYLPFSLAFSLSILANSITWFIDFFHNSLSSSLLFFFGRSSSSGLLGVTTCLKMACLQEPPSILGEPSSEATDFGLLPTFKNLKIKDEKKWKQSSFEEETIYMSIIGDLSPLSDPFTRSGDTDPFWAFSPTDKCASLRSLCEPMVEVRDLVPSDSLSEVSALDGENGEDSYNASIDNLNKISLKIWVPYLLFVWEESCPSVLGWNHLWKLCVSTGGQKNL